MRNVKLFEEFSNDDDQVSMQDLFVAAHSAVYVSVNGREKVGYRIATDGSVPPKAWFDIFPNGEDFKVRARRDSLIELYNDEEFFLSASEEAEPKDRSILYDARLSFTYVPVLPFMDSNIDEVVSRSPAMKRYMARLLAKLTRKGKIGGLKDLESAEEFFRSDLGWAPEGLIPEDWKMRQRSRGAFGRF